MNIYPTRLTRRISHALLLFLALCAPVVAADKPQAENEYDDAWVQNYYKHPQPEQFETQIKKMQAAGVLRIENAIPPLAAFSSRLFQSAKPDQLSQWVQFMDSLPDPDKQVFLIALRWADTPETKDALKKIAAKKGNSAAHAKKLLKSDAPAIEKLTDPSPDELDMCWGAFFATGEAKYVLPVIRCAAQPDKPGLIDLSQQSARWSLKSLGDDHQKIREIKDAFYKTATPEQRKSLDDLFKKNISTPTDHAK